MSPMDEQDKYGKAAAEMVYHSESPATVVAIRLRADGLEIERLRALDKVSAKVHNSNLVEMGNMREEIERFKTRLAFANEGLLVVHDGQLQAEIDRLTKINQQQHEQLLAQATIVVEANTECNQMQAEIAQLKAQLINLSDVMCEWRAKAEIYEREAGRLNNALAAHRRFHGKVGCSGAGCYVCDADEAISAI